MLLLSIPSLSLLLLGIRTFISAKEIAAYKAVTFDWVTFDWDKRSLNASYEFIILK